MSLKMQMVSDFILITNNANANQLQHNIICKPTFTVTGESTF